jgi:hypothetical protein
MIEINRLRSILKKQNTALISRKDQADTYEKFIKHLKASGRTNTEELSSYFKKKNS